MEAQHLPVEMTSSLMQMEPAGPRSERQLYWAIKEP
jgi:hypothetical protein